MATETQTNRSVADELLPPDTDPNPKVKILTSERAGCCTYEIRSESHTMGNALRWGLQKNKKVNFAGYTIPHPSENCLHLRVQTVELDEIPTSKAMEESFETLENIIDHMMITYEDVVQKFLNHNSDEIMSQ
jgi:DNA-directed RNA polymerases I and III subunit RPAC2